MRGGAPARGFARVWFVGFGVQGLASGRPASGRAADCQQRRGPRRLGPRPRPTQPTNTPKSPPPPPRRTFTYARCPVRPMYPLFDTMLGVVKKYDPKGVFEPPLWSKLVKQENFKYYPGCATDYE